MPDHPTRTPTDASDELFDRYTLPKVALTVILAASLVGTWVTTTLTGGAAVVVIAAKWAYLVALGVLTGGLVWKHLFVRPADLGAEAGDYCAEMYARFDRIAAGALAVLAVGGAVVLWEYLRTFGPTTGASLFAGVLLSLVTLGALTVRSAGPVATQFRNPVGLVALALALGAVAATGVAEVAVSGFDPVAAVVRVLHLLAFAVWIGGAVWNIFVAVPTGQNRPTVAVVRAAGEQLERFRWAVRFIIPTLLLTGLYQAADGLGTSLGPYLGSVVGVAVLAKVGSILVLVAIFKLCPMWRACSPIEGVCELDDLGEGGPAESDRPDGGTTRAGPNGDEMDVTGDD